MNEPNNFVYYKYKSNEAALEMKNSELRHIGISRG
jgi:hypothetical protein